MLDPFIVYQSVASVGFLVFCLNHFVSELVDGRIFGNHKLVLISDFNSALIHFICQGQKEGGEKDFINFINENKRTLSFGDNGLNFYRVINMWEKVKRSVCGPVAVKDFLSIHPHASYIPYKVINKVKNQEDFILVIDHFKVFADIAVKENSDQYYELIERSYQALTIEGRIQPTDIDLKELCVYFSWV